MKIDVGGQRVSRLIGVVLFPSENAFQATETSTSLIDLLT